MIDHMFLLKKINYFFLFFSLLLIPTNSFAGKWGKGELKLDPIVADYFITYIRGEQFKYPSIFYVTLDGSDGVYWYCPERTNCQSGSPSQERATCRQYTGKECAAFARMRTIKWENDINPGKGKVSQINSKWTDQEILDKLTELDFFDN